MIRIIPTALAALMLVLSALPAATSARTPIAEATPVPATACTTDPDSGLLLYTDWLVGQPGGDVVVADGAGQELGRIEMPPPVAGFATQGPGRGLVWTESDGVYLVDAVAGEARLLDIPLETVARLLPVPALWWSEPGEGWAVLGGRMQQAAYLVNLDTGETHDLAATIAALGDEYPETQFALVSPDDRHLLLWTGLGLYLIETANPDQVRVLGDGASLAAPGFFRDGGAGVVYSRVNDAGQMELVTEDLATGTEQVVDLGRVMGERRVLPQPLPDPERVMLVWVNGPLNAVTGGAYEVLDVTTGRVRFLASSGPTTGVTLVNPPGDRVLAGGQRPNGAGWALLDLDTGDATALPDLTGMINLRGGVANSTFFFPASAMALTVEGEPGAPYLSLDLNTGAVQTLLLQQPGATYGFPVVSGGPDPRLALRVANETRSALVLLDPVSGRARTVAEGDDIGGVFSPDGCWLAAVAGDGTMTLLPVTGEGGVEVSARSGTVPVWLHPAP